MCKSEMLVAVDRICDANADDVDVPKLKLLRGGCDGTGIVRYIYSEYIIEVIGSVIWML